MAKNLSQIASSLRISVLWTRAIGCAASKGFTKGIMLTNKALELFKKAFPERIFPPPQLLLIRAHMLLREDQLSEALNGYEEFLKALNSDKRLTDDNKTYLAIYAGKDAQYLFNKLGHVTRQNELQPLIDAGFQSPDGLLVKPIIKRRFPVSRSGQLC
jgi:hypothetical protein